MTGTLACPSRTSSGSGSGSASTAVSGEEAGCEVEELRAHSRAFLILTARQAGRQAGRQGQVPTSVLQVGNTCRPPDGWW